MSFFEIAKIIFLGDSIGTYPSSFRVFLDILVPLYSDSKVSLWYAAIFPLGVSSEIQNYKWRVTVVIYCMYPPMETDIYRKGR